MISNHSTPTFNYALSTKSLHMVLRTGSPTPKGGGKLKVTMFFSNTTIFISCVHEFSQVTLLLFLGQLSWHPSPQKSDLGVAGIEPATYGSAGERSTTEL